MHLIAFSTPILAHALPATHCPVSLSVKKVKDLEPESKGHNLHVKVVELHTVLEKTKFDGVKITIGEVTTRTHSYDRRWNSVARLDC